MNEKELLEYANATLESRNISVTAQDNGIIVWKDNVSGTDILLCGYNTLMTTLHGFCEGWNAAIGRNSNGQTASH